MFVPALVGRPAYRLYQWAWAGLDLLFPPRCGGCETQGSRWCVECINKAKLIASPVCEKCGQSLEPAGNRTVSSAGAAAGSDRVFDAGRWCAACQAHPPHYTALRSWAVFQGPLRNAILRLKYKGDVSLAEALSRPLVGLLHGLGWKPEIATAVPSSRTRRAQRGYNQANLLAFPLALGAGLTFRPAALAKVRETRTQVGLSAAERRLNINGAFVADPRQVSGRSVLVVDDVTTSGATMEACAWALLEAGARQVVGLTLGRAVLAPAGSGGGVSPPRG